MTRILITGASDGLGRALAFALADRGYELIVHGRDAGRLAEVAEVRRLAAEVDGDLDVLVNNAGIGFGAPGAPRELSADGYELRLAVNYLAPYLLTQLLLPRLKRAAPSRIVNVASIGQRPFDVDDPMMVRGYDGTEAYRRAKLALIAYTFDLAEELAGTGVTANCLHPATLMPTTMVVEAGTGHIDTLERGLQATLRLIVDPELEGVTGRYFDREREGRALDQAYDPDFRKRLRELTESLVSGRG